MRASYGGTQPRRARLGGAITTPVVRRFAAVVVSLTVAAGVRGREEERMGLGFRAGAAAAPVLSRAGAISAVR